MKFLPLITVAFVVVFSSCETEVDLNATYKNTTVVFGLINPDFNGDNLINALDTQWIKINKTFLGSGDNTVYAGIRDSSEYKDEDFESKVVERRVDGNVVFTYPIFSTTVSNKSIDGIFYGPEQTLYYFVPEASGLPQSAEYHIKLKFTDGREVDATTDVVNYAGFSFITPQVNASLILAQPSSLGGVNFVDPVSVRWYSASNAKLYDVMLRFHYTEEIYSGPTWPGVPISSTVKFVDYRIGSQIAAELSAGNPMKVEFGGLGFFTFLKNNIAVNANARRIIGYLGTDQKTRCFEVILTMGNEELASYIEVNTVSGSIIQERPVYTNVNNGLGLFASRGSRKVTDIKLVGTDNNNIPNPGNLFAFFLPGLTAELNFCDPNPTSDYYCH